MAYGGKCFFPHEMIDEVIPGSGKERQGNAGAEVKEGTKGLN